jgi:glutathione S-transferase
MLTARLCACWSPNAQVDLATKPAEFIELYHSIVTDKAAKEAVPVIVDGKTRLVESRIISEFLARQYNTGTPLLPPDAASQALVQLFIQQFHAKVVPPYLRLIHVEEQKAKAEATKDLLEALAAMDDFINLHGGYQGDHAVGPHYSWSMHSSVDQGAEEQQQQQQYFMGPYYSLAEVSCTPFVARMVQVLPEWREVDVMQLCKDKGLSRMVSWMEACLQRPSARLTGPKKDELVEGLAEWEWSHAM